MRVSVLSALFICASAVYASPVANLQPKYVVTTTTTKKSTTTSAYKTTTTTTTSVYKTTTTTTTTSAYKSTTTTSAYKTTTTSAKPAYTPPAGVNASEIYVNGITYGGTGCPQGTVGTYISADRTTFTLIFDSYVASIGTGVAITENRKNCQLNIDIRYPQGFQYSVFSMDYRGYAELDAGVTGTQIATYYFSGYSQQVSTSSSIAGPHDDNYLIEDQISSTSVVWSPCGEEGALNINSQIALKSNPSGQNGLLTTDSEDGKFTYILGLQWAQC